MKFTVVHTQERDLMPGDMIKDANGVIWLALIPQKVRLHCSARLSPATRAQAVWFTEGYEHTEHHENDVIAVEHIPQPVMFITALDRA